MRSVVFLMLLANCAALCAASLTGRVVRVIDGDTIVILGEGNAQHKIQLQGIDAPERGQAYDTRSKEHLSGLLSGRFVVVEYDKKQHGQVVGKVLVSGDDSGLNQVFSGFAWHYDTYPNEQTEADQVHYSEAETEARKQKRGLWQDPDAVPPWEYRELKRR